MSIFDFRPPESFVYKNERAEVEASEIKPKKIKVAPKGSLGVGEYKFKLEYCSKCNRSWKCTPLRNKLCFECGLRLQFKCAKCKKLFLTRPQLTRHLARYCNNVAKLRCEHCEYVTNQKVSLAAHILAKHLPVDPSLTRCNECGKVYSSRSNLTRHNKYCGSSKMSKMRFRCDLCSFGAAYKANLEKHVMVLHGDQNVPGPPVCKSCGKSFQRPGNYERHVGFCGLRKPQKPKKVYYCDFCGYKAIRKRLLVGHIEAKHTNCDFSCCVS